jgi:hypothetical protein
LKSKEIYKLVRENEELKKTIRNLQKDESDDVLNLFHSLPDSVKDHGLREEDQRTVSKFC